VYKASVETASFQPTIAFKPNDKLSLAAGLEVIFGKMDLRQNIKVVGEDIHMHPEGVSWSWILSAQYDVSEMVSVAVNYRKGFVFKARGDFMLNDKYIDDMTMSANFPGTLSAGISVEPTDDLKLEFDVVHSFWSDFTSMEYDFSNKINAASLAIAANNTTSVKNYRDSTRLQLGAEYQAWDGVFLRAGYAHDPSPQNSEYMDYMLPANDRNLFSTGLGLELGDFSLDFSYIYLISNDYVIDNNVGGTNRSVVDNGVTHIGGLNFSYKF
jgi:long-chain fatty acid transport protein